MLKYTKGTLICKNEVETLLIASLLAFTTDTPKIISLFGDFSTGKTIFCKGFILYFYYKKINITSPSYSILNSYNVTPKIYHMDLYRVRNKNNSNIFNYLQDFLDEIFLLMEWPDKSIKYPLKDIINISIIHKRGNLRKLNLLMLDDK